LAVVYQYNIVASDYKINKLSHEDVFITAKFFIQAIIYVILIYLNIICTTFYNIILRNIIHYIFYYKQFTVFQ